jgi:hypothetical protein
MGTLTLLTIRRHGVIKGQKEGVHRQMRVSTQCEWLLIALILTALDCVPSHTNFHRDIFYLPVL